MGDALRDLLPVIVDREQAVMPDGFDSWGIKSVRPDLSTAHNFRWPFPGSCTSSYDAVDALNIGACPSRIGDGLCIATTWQGMASGGIDARTLLLVAYQSEWLLGYDEDMGKFRVGGPVAVVALIDGWRLVVEEGERANLKDADLRGADLSGANLRNADLSLANLDRTFMRMADLRGADLSDAYLRRAYSVPTSQEPI